VTEEQAMGEGRAMPPTDKYPLSMRILHWVRAALIFGLIWAGWTMTRLADEVPAKFAIFYPNHKQFGILVLLLGVIHLVIRWRRRGSLPEIPVGLAPWEAKLSHFVHRAIMVLLILVPLMGYCMSSSFTQSDGVPFFVGNLPELLPKNDAAFAWFQLIHKIAAYTLLGLVALHIAGALKHRFLDRRGDTDVLRRMM